MNDRKRPKLREDGIATRADIRFDTDAERLCRITLGLVESMGASEALTNAVIHLDRARNFIADHVEAIDRQQDYRTMVCCEVSPGQRAEHGCSQCKPLARVGLPTTDEPTCEPRKLCEHGWNRAHNELVGPGQLTKVPCPGPTDDERPAKDGER